MKRSSRFWAAVIATLLALSLAGCLRVWLLSRGGTVANIYLDGELVRSIDLARLDEGFSFSVEGPAGANTIQAEPGRIRVSHADCPDQVCVHQGWISSAALGSSCSRRW